MLLLLLFFSQAGRWVPVTTPAPGGAQVTGGDACFRGAARLARTCRAAAVTRRLAMPLRALTLS